MSRTLKITALTLLALIAFAANSVFGRLALLDDNIGPWSYTLIRLLSGAIVLCILTGFKASREHGSWQGASALVIYAVFFSYAYLMLSAGAGALILFAIVQLTMLGYGFLIGERLSFVQWGGFLLAVAGLIYLMAPGIEAPSLYGSLLMIGSGIGWGAYSILGKRGGDPSAQTSGNFVRATLILAALSLPGFYVINENSPNIYGLSLAIASGAITSALGYVIWYRVLKDIPLTTAAISQLSVPVIAALGGMMFIREPITLRFFIASVLILSGIGLSVIYKKPSKVPQ